MDCPTDWRQANAILIFRRVGNIWLPIIDLYLLLVYTACKLPSSLAKNDAPLCFLWMSRHGVSHLHLQLTLVHEHVHISLITLAHATTAQIQFHFLKTQTTTNAASSSAQLFSFYLHLPHIPCVWLEKIYIFFKIIKISPKVILVLQNLFLKKKVYQWKAYH